MKDATSLENLHDIVLPPNVSWWPPSPAWFFLFALLMGLFVWKAYRVAQHWRANAYRREALSSLTRCDSPTAIAELLRRTALAATPRTQVASQTGEGWIDWLAAHLNEPIPDPVRKQLMEGVYATAHDPGNLDELRSFAARWIAHHQLTDSALER